MFWCREIGGTAIFYFFFKLKKSIPLMIQIGMDFQNFRVTHLKKRVNAFNIYLIMISLNNSLPN
ncbi:hypothetical protein AM598_08930, partial [Paenibacillus polymyxa]